MNFDQAYNPDDFARFVSDFLPYRTTSCRQNNTFIAILL